MSSTDVITLGCRLNTFESEVMRQNAEDAGLTDTVIVNTCAVTKDAERQARQTIRRLRRDRPDARIVVSGCAAQINPDQFAEMPEVDQVLGNTEKLDRRYLDPASSDTRVQVSDIMTEQKIAPATVRGFEGRSRAFVQVQQGCDHRCTFCIIPYGRGNSRSLAPEKVIEQVRTLVGEGYREIIVTGVDISSYGTDLPDGMGLGGLVQKILSDVPAVQRLRLSSVDPAVVDEQLFEAMATDSRLMPHLHLSMQAGDDMILKRMKRRHSREQAVDLCARYRAVRPEIVLGADLIAGFPTETDKMFENGLDFIAECGLTHLHVFPYSPRPGTPAADMPQVPATVRKDRATAMRQAGEAALAAYIESQIGSLARVLIEKNGNGYTEQYVPAQVGFAAVQGEIVEARLTGSDGLKFIAG